MAFDRKSFDLEGVDLLSHAIFADEDVIAFDNVRDIRLDGKVKIENFIVALCNKGRGALTINGTEYKVGVDDFIICRPNIILENLMESVDFECSCCLCLSTEFMQNIVLMANSWNFKQMLEKTPVFHLCKEDSAVVNAYATLLKYTLQGEGQRHRKEALESLMRAAACYFTDMLYRHMDAAPMAFCKSETLFNSFVDLLSERSPRQRRVDWYAGRLGVTNRRLAAVCLRVSGKTALALINEYVVRDIKRELLKPENTIKKVAIDMKFDNVSCLGRYFRNATGMSPKTFRAAYVRDMFPTDGE